MALPFVLAIVVQFLGADAPVTLRPANAVGEATRVVVELRAEGLFKPAAEPGAKAGVWPKPLAVKVETRLEYAEKTLAIGKDGAASRVIRRVEKAGVAINGEVRATSSTIRPEVAVLVAEPRGGQVVVVSTGGPLTRSELELVGGPGDPLALVALLPAGGVRKGDTWSIGSDAARSLSEYDTLDDNAVRATLESIDDARAVARLKGEIRGSRLGGRGTIGVTGSFVFDRKAGRVESLEVERAEVREAGAVEAGLDIKSTLKVARNAADLPPELADAALSGVPLEIKPDSELLLFKSPDGKYSFIHDRDWHIDWDGDRQTLFKRLIKGQVEATCTLSRGPNAGKGRHQDPAQLRDDIKKAAGTRFVAVLGEGVVDGAEAGGYRYKVAVQGREGDVDVLWYYYLIAGPEGDQVLAVFTLTLSRKDSFGDHDLRLIGTFEWSAPAARP